MKRGFIATAALMLLNAPLAAQNPPAWHAGGAELSRAQLEQMLTQYEALLTDESRHAAQREQLIAEAALIRQRLGEGDLRVGDRVALEVEGFAQLTDTFSVNSNRAIILPEIGEINVGGVLRSELQPQIAAHIGRFINNPVVRAKALVRIQLSGAVGRPGFYAVPADILLGDVLMMAGGPVGNADLNGIRIRRGQQEVWSKERLRTAMMDGRTLDQLSIRAGDEIQVPERGGRMNTFRDVALTLTGLAGIVTLLLQVF